MKSFGPISIVSLFNPSCFQHVAPFQLRYLRFTLVATKRRAERNIANKKFARSWADKVNLLESSSLSPPSPRSGKGRQKTGGENFANKLLPSFRDACEKKRGRGRGEEADDAVSSWRKIWIIPAICIRKISRRSTFPAHLSPCLPLPSSRGNYLSRKFRGNYRVVRRFIELQV